MQCPYACPHLSAGNWTHVPTEAACATRSICKTLAKQSHLQHSMCLHAIACRFMSMARIHQPLRCVLKGEELEYLGPHV